MIIIYLIFILLLFILLNYYHFEYFNNNNNNNNNNIPLILYKTGPFNIIPNDILNVINNSCINLNCKYKYFNDYNCDEFIKNNFNYNIYKAYNSLIPTAYKADLWRYCILYKYGGIYGDLTQNVINNYDVNKNNADIILVKDRNVCNSNNNIQISFIAVKQYNNFMRYLINNITNDILQKHKGLCPLDITGPRAFGRYFCKYFNINLINLGLRYYKGLDNKIYKIDISLYMKNSDFIHNYYDNDSIFLKNKIENHIKLLYKNNNSIKNKNKYDYQWKNNIIYKK